jgi:hypothetical protein
MEYENNGKTYKVDEEFKDYKGMKLYKFVGDPEQYNGDNDGVDVALNMVFESMNTPYGWNESIQWHADTYPSDWELVEEESKAMRFNSDKPKLSLISMKELEPMARVLQFGADKYARDNWKKGLVMSEILDSMMRHIAAIQSGELIDPESKLSHIGHIQCNALFLAGENNINDLTNDKGK